MIKLREPFSQKVHLHIRQNMLQRLWDKYVPASSAEYGKIELVYLKDALGDIGQQPEQIQLLLHLLVKNKKIQLNLMQYPAPVKICRKQMESSLRRMERYYAAQLKCSDFTLYRTVKQYLTLLEQAQEDRRRYQEWQKNYQEIEKQKDEYRLISLFSEKLREYLAEYSVNTLRMMEREFVHSLSETEYRTLAEELIWQEKPEVLTYFAGWEEAQCENVVRELEKDSEMKHVLSLIPDQPVKEKMIAAVEKLEQREFCLFYHQVMQLENVEPQVVIWKENRTEMISEVDRLESETLQQMWKQMEDVTRRPEQETLWLQEKGSSNQSALQTQEQDIQNLETLRTLEKELLYSLLETEYRTLAEQLIWQEKPELIAYFKACEKDRCKEIVKTLEKDLHLRRILSSQKKQSAKKKLVAAAYKLEQKEFSLFYRQVVDLENVNPQMVIWKKSKTEMLRSIDGLEPERVQKVWTQVESVGSMKGSKHIFAEKMLYLQNRYQQNESRNFREQIAVILEENALQSIADIVDMKQLTQDFSIAEYIEKPAGFIEKPIALEFGLGESAHSGLWVGAYQVIRNLEREQEMRRERIERQQAQVVETYRDTYRQIVRTEPVLVQQQEDTVQSAERIFRERYREQLTGEEIRNIYEWSRALLEVHFAEQGQAESFSPNQKEQPELTYVVGQINHYMEEQYGFGERLILHRQEEVSKDERIRKLLRYIRQLDEEQRETFIHYLGDMVRLSVQRSSQRNASTVVQSDRTESTGLPIQSNKQEAVKKLLQAEDREFAEKLLRVEDREFAKRLLQIEDRELIEKLLQIEDREFAEKLLQIEDREFAEKLLRIEDREFVERLLQIEDSELTEKLLRIENGEFAGKMLQNNDRQLPDVSYRSLWEWGETLLFHSEHQQEWEDADILSAPQQEVFPFDEAKQEDVQIQVIRRQIEMAKDRNRLQSLLRQINHQADLQLVYTDARLKLPQVRDLLHYVQQLDEKQYGALVKELVQIIKVQKLSYGKLETAAADVNTGEENHLSGTGETNAVTLHNKANSVQQSIQGDAYESAGKLLRTEDKEFIEKLLQVEDREFAKKLLQVEDREFIDRLLQVEDREFAKKLLQVEDREFIDRLLQVEDREFAKRLLQIENREFAERLLQIEDRELAERLLQIENREFAERLLRIENEEFIRKLLLDDGRQSQDVSYRNLWEWGEALLQHPEYQSEQKGADIISESQQEAFSTYGVQQEDEQTQMMHQQIEVEKAKSHLQSLIRQINHRADLRLVYTDAQLRVPQIQALLQYIRQLDVRQYGAFVKELAQVTMIQKLSYDEPGAAAHVGEVTPLPGTSATSLEQRIVSYPILAQYIQDYEKQRQLEFYRDVRKIEQKIFPQAYEKEPRQYVPNDAGSYVQETAAYGLAPYESVVSDYNLASYETSSSEYTLIPYEGRESAYELMSYEADINEYSLTRYEEPQKEYGQITTYERNLRESRYQPQELEYSVQKASESEEDRQRNELRLQQENARIKSAQEQLDKKLKEVEHHLKKVEDSTKAKEDVRNFAEQVKQQLYEELHVEKLRRGLI